MNKVLTECSVIRICGIKSVMRLMARIPDLYVIATFRDPRGIFRSRNHFLGGRPMTWDTVGVYNCRRLLLSNTLKFEFESIY